MSTKIYTGFKFRGTIHELLDTIETFRPWIAARAQEQLGRFLVPGQVKMTDWLDMRRQMKRTGERNPLVDTDFQICVFPRLKGWIGIVYTEHDAWFREWLSLPKVSEYWYWDNSDAPKGMPARAWRQRRHDWERALLNKGHGVPAMHGLTIDVSDPLGPMPISVEKAG